MKWLVLHRHFPVYSASMAHSDLTEFLKGRGIDDKRFIDEKVQYSLFYYFFSIDHSFAYAIYVLQLSLGNLELCCSSTPLQGPQWPSGLGRWVIYLYCLYRSL